MPIQLIRKIRAIRLRLQWIDFCLKCLAVAKWVGLALLTFLVVSRLVPLPVGLEQVGFWTGLCGSVLILVWCLARPVRLFDAALRADERLGLKERLSSALLVGDPRRPAELAVVRDAAEHARSIRPGRVFRLEAGREFGWAAGPLVLLALVWWLMPQFDLLARQERAPGADKPVDVAVRKEAVKRIEALAKEIAASAELRKPVIAGQLEKELKALARKLEMREMPQERALAAVMKMQDRIDARKTEIEKKLSKPADLQTKGLGKHSQELGKSLKQGNFKNAAKLLDELKEKLKSGGLSEKEKTALGKELEMLAGKLGKDSALADALGKAAEKLEAGQFNAALAELEDAGGAMLDLEAMLKELSTLESLGYDMDARKLALCASGLCANCQCSSPCLGGNCAGAGAVRPWRAGDNRGSGNGMGGPGIGRGGVARSDPHDVAFKQTRVRGDLTPGKIIARMKVPGQQTPGEASVAYEEMRTLYEQKAEDTIRNEVMPLEHKALIREYFAAIKRAESEKSD